MEKFKKVLLAIGLMFMLSNGDTYATSTAVGGESDSMKIILFVVAIILIVAILVLSYKADKPTELKPKKKKVSTDGKDKKEKNGKKDKLKDELFEKDNTYEVEENEVYEDDKIEPVSIAKDEDEISLFESVNNPDTEREEFIIEEEVPNTTMQNPVSSNVVTNMPSYNDDDDTVNDFFSMDDEEDELVQESVIEESAPAAPVVDIFADGMLDMDEEMEEEVKSNNDMGGTMVFNSEELNGKLDIFSMNEEDAEEEIIGVPNVETSNDDLFTYNYDDIEDEVEEKVEDVQKIEEVEEPKVEPKKELNILAPEPEETEFVGFTTLKPKAQTRGGNSRFERPSAEKEVEVKNVDTDNSADDFLAQMEQNLGGKSAAKTTKKTTTKKVTETKKTPAKKPAAKKTTATKTKADK